MNKDGRALQVLQGCCSIVEGGSGAEDDQGLQKQATKLTAIKKKREIFDQTRSAEVERGDGGLTCVTALTLRVESGGCHRLRIQVQGST